MIIKRHRKVGLLHTRNVFGIKMLREVGGGRVVVVD